MKLTGGGTRVHPRFPIPAPLQAGFRCSRRALLQILLWAWAAALLPWAPPAGVARRTGGASGPQAAEVPRDAANAGAPVGRGEARPWGGPAARGGFVAYDRSCGLPHCPGRVERGLGRLVCPCEGWPAVPGPGRALAEAPRWPLPPHA